MIDAIGMQLLGGLHQALHNLVNKTFLGNHSRIGKHHLRESLPIATLKF